MKKPFFFLEGSASTHLKVIHQRRGPPLVQDHQVPVFLESPDSFQTDQWDLTTQQVWKKIFTNLRFFLSVE